MSRRVPATAVCLVLASLLAGCSGEDAPAGSDASPGVLSGAITVQVSGSDSEISALQETADAFETLSPGTTVEVVGVADQGDHIAKLSTAFAGGNPPDVFLLNYRRLGRFAESGVVAPADLGPLDREDFYAPAVDAFTFDGTLLCLPQNVSSVVVYLNPELFDRAGVALPRPGWTWAEMLEQARALAAAGVDAIGFDPTFRTVPAFVWSAGGEVVDDTAKPTRVTLDTAEGRKALQFLLDLQATGPDATERAAETPNDRFANGRLAMFLDSRRAVPGFRKATELTFDVARLPTDRSSSSLLASDGYCVTKKAKNPALAQAFARYAVGPDGGAVLARAGRTVPSLRSLAESPVFLDPAQQPRSSRVFLDVIPTLRALPSVAAWNEAEGTAGEILEQLFAGNLSLDEAVRKVESDTATVFDQE